VRTLSTPQRTTVVWHSDGRPLEGYSVEYTRISSPDEPEAETDTDSEEDAEGGRDENDEADQTAEAEAEQSAVAEDEETAASGTTKKAEKERTPSASATEKEQEPSREPSDEISGLPEESSQMTALSDGEELRTTSLNEFEDEGDEENLRSLVVAGGIIIVGLIAGAIALLVRLPGQR
jgi:sRNA-binding protein